MWLYARSMYSTEQSPNNQLHLSYPVCIMINLFASANSRQKQNETRISKYIYERKNDFY